MSGAQSSNGTTEAETNLKIALKVQTLLEQSGATVILTRSDENAIYDVDSKTLKQKKISDIHNRVKVGNESSADIFVSIHLNKIPQQQYYGWQTFYKVILPTIFPALLTGFALSFARALGEYGSVVFIAGNMPFKTEISTLLIITKLEQYDFAGATAIAVVMLLISFMMLLLINILQRWSSRRKGMEAI